MMNCDRGFLQSSGVWRVPVCGGSEGSFDPDHDAVIRIGGKAPGGGPILSVGIKCQVRIRLPATSDLNSAVMLKSQCERRMVLSGLLVPASRFTSLDARRRPPMAHQ